MGVRYAVAPEPLYRGVHHRRPGRSALSYARQLYLSTHVVGVIIILYRVTLSRLRARARACIYVLTYVYVCLCSTSLTPVDVAEYRGRRADP